MIKNKMVIACGSLRPELEKLQLLVPEVEIKFLPQNLHRHPDKLKNELQEAINHIDKSYKEAALGYGLCSNGIVGVKAPAQGLYIPKAHDCITLYMGSKDKYSHVFKEIPGTYYLTRAWIEEEKDPLSQMENEYTERVGREFAEYAMKEEIKNYSHICFINTGIGDTEKYRLRAKENAMFFEKEYIEMEYKNELLLKTLQGPYPANEFIYVEPNQLVKQKDFLN